MTRSQPFLSMFVVRVAVGILAPRHSPGLYRGATGGDRARPNRRLFGNVRPLTDRPLPPTNKSLIPARPAARMGREITTPSRCPTMWTTVTVIGIAAVILVLLLVFFFVAVYNALVMLRNQYKNSFAQIDVQLRRRYDLIPNLVETVKGYMTHERETLESVIKARNSAFNAGQKAAANPGNPEAMTELNQAEAQLTGSLGRLMALAEAYPDLKANQTMASLQEELSSTENKISYARQAYNDAVTAYNSKRESFPTTLVAGTFAFTEAKLLEANETAAQRDAPKVSFK